MSSHLHEWTVTIEMDTYVCVVCAWMCVYMHILYMHIFCFYQIHWPGYHICIAHLYCEDLYCHDIEILVCID